MATASTPAHRRGTGWPWAAEEYGPLSVMLVLLTMVTGLVDAVSFIALGRVFVANMTGNVVFVGFALAGAQGLSAPASITALAVFVGGALIGGFVVRRHGDHHARLMRALILVKVPLIVLAAVLAAAAPHALTGGWRYAVLVPLSAAMGMQNTAALRLNVPALRTTVMTLTLTAMAADFAAGRRRPAEISRGLISATAMFSGAVVGGLFVVHVHVYVALLLVVALQLVAGCLAHRNAAVEASWARPRAAT